MSEYSSGNPLLQKLLLLPVLWTMNEDETNRKDGTTESSSGGWLKVEAFEHKQQKSRFGEELDLNPEWIGLADMNFGWIGLAKI